MANTYKNIVITPNISTEANVVPSIRFSGGDATSNTDIHMKVYTTSNGTLSFEGSAGQLFSVTNDLTNSIFSVNDVSGIPSIDVYANGNIYLAPFGGNTSIRDTLYVDEVTKFVGVSTLRPAANLQVNGSMFITQNNTSSMQVIGEIAEFATNSNSYAQIHIRNANNVGTIASGDLVVTTDVGTDVSDFIDLGINNGGFNDTNWTINGRLDGYLYTSNGNLAIGVANTNRSIVFFTGGVSSASEDARFDPSGNLLIGRTNSTVGNNVKLDVNGAINASSIFINGSNNISTVAINYVIDGAGSTITTGQKGYLEIPFNCILNTWSIYLDQTGSIAIQVWADTYANFPPTVADNINASAFSVTTAQKAQGSVDSANATILAGETLAFNVVSVTSATRATIALKATKT